MIWDGVPAQSGDVVGHPVQGGPGGLWDGDTEVDGHAQELLVNIVLGAVTGEVRHHGLVCITIMEVGRGGLGMMMIVVVKIAVVEVEHAGGQLHFCRGHCRVEERIPVGGCRFKGGKLEIVHDQR